MLRTVISQVWSWPRSGRPAVRPEMQQAHHEAAARPVVEALESRVLLSASFPPGGVLEDQAADLTPALMVDQPDPLLVQKMIVAGDPYGSPADSPGDRVDPNTTTSAYAGVGSLFMDLGGGWGYLGSATVIGSTYVLTAAHCVDADDNGTVDFDPLDVTFYLNYGTDLSHAITASAIYVHPDFTGFANPSVNDDLAVIELSQPVPAGVPIYGLSAEPFVNVETITLAGYGTTGDGVSGYEPDTASFTVKRVGWNNADVYISDDEGSGAREVFEFDFDGDGKKTNVFGPPRPYNLTLGNDVETTIGPGDSGGPSFIDDGSGHLVLFGVNTFTVGGRAGAPLFGSVGGGIVVAPYVDWIYSVMNQSPINQSPIADAGPDQNVTTGQIVQLDGSASSDPEGGPLTCNWTLSTPAGSSAALSDPTAVNPTFTPDVDGEYVATLVVNDGNSYSAPDSVTITAGVAASSMHVGDLDGIALERGKSGNWEARVTVMIEDDGGQPVAGATVAGTWSGAAGGNVSGVTGADGTVTLSTGKLSGGTSVKFTVTGVTGLLSYSPGGNHDPDGDSDGTTITVERAARAGAAASDMSLSRLFALWDAGNRGAGTSSGPASPNAGRSASAITTPRPLKWSSLSGTDDADGQSLIFPLNMG